MINTQKLHIVVQQGADFDVTHIWNTSEVDADDNPIPVDLTGCHVVMQLKEEFDSPSVLLEASTYNGFINVEPEAGKIIVDIPADYTRNLSFTRAVHDLIVIWPDGDITRLLEGSAELSPGVTLTWATNT